MVKLSRPSKMPCFSWSLQALDTCPGSKKSNGELVDACKGCYATDGNYLFKNVKNVRAHNKQDWKRKAWVSDMVKELDNSRYFRWFDSGDVYSVRLAEKLLQVMKQTPWVSHWLPTRMHKFPKFAKVFQQMEALPNVVVRFSSDSVAGAIIEGETTSTITEFAEEGESIGAVCEAYTRDGKCGDCRQCWQKAVPVIVYPAHGRKMRKQYKMINAIAL
tara:strand:+ start:219 stop:869 length:651 start_codon:yes stop_codon:yes gene_type:complete